MSFLNSFKNVFKPEQIEHEAIDLKTGKSITLVKVRQADGSYIIKRIKDTERPRAETPKPGKIHIDEITHVHKDKAEAKPIKLKLDMHKFTSRLKRGGEPVKREVTVREAAEPPKSEKEKVDLIDLLETDIDRAIKIKEERDLLVEKMHEFETRLEDFDEHKSARKHAETKVTEYEDSIVKLKEEKADLEKSIVELKEERDTIKDKINYYEEVLVKIKDTIVKFDREIA